MSEESSKEVLNVALADIITKATTGIEAATQFALDEIPDVLYQALLWYGVYNFILFLVALAILVCVPFATFKYWKWAMTKVDEDYAEPVIGGGAVVTIFVIVGAIILFSSTLNLTWLKIWIAPKLWLIEYGVSLVK